MAGLRREAEKISPLAVKLVDTKAGWSEPVKTLLVESGSAVAAKWMNRFGISAEYAPEVTLGTAICSLWASRAALMGELKTLALEAARERERAKAVAEVKA